ncbi:hypothetical protein JW977_03735 [Candidatus Falkowbacteria bacterium]|nr:hypothetical protein [Candidatus Falkowbacteria bacterium]
MDNKNTKKVVIEDITLNIKIREILDKYKIESKKAELVKKVIRDLFEGKIDEYDLGGEISEKANIDFKIALDLATELKEGLFPLLLEKIPGAKSQLYEEKRDLESILEKIKKESNIRVDLKYKKRLDDIILNWFRNIRDDQETIDTLTKSAKVGGIGLEYSVASNLVNILNKKKEEFKANNVDILSLISEDLKKQEEIEETEIDVAAKVKGPMVAEKAIQDIHIEDLLKEKGISYNELAQKETIKQELTESKPVIKVPDLAEEIIEEEEFLESKKEIEAPKIEPEPLPPPPPPPAPAPQPLPPKPIEPVKKIEPKAPKIQTRPPIIRRTDTDNRPKMEDVKVEVSTTLYGPIEELNALSVMDFRRLSKDPKEAAFKIISKLDLLEDESLIKKMQGIKALRSSPLYKMYAEIMNRAMMAGKSIEQVISESNTLTMPEYQAIMELNQSLKY